MGFHTNSVICPTVSMSSLHVTTIIPRCSFLARIHLAIASQTTCGHTKILQKLSLACPKADNISLCEKFVLFDS